MRESERENALTYRAAVATELRRAPVVLLTIAAVTVLCGGYTDPAWWMRGLVILAQLATWMVWVLLLAALARWLAVRRMRERLAHAILQPVNRPDVIRCQAHFEGGQSRVIVLELLAQRQADGDPIYSHPTPLNGLIGFTPIDDVPPGAVLNVFGSR